MDKLPCSSGDRAPTPLGRSLAGRSRPILAAVTALTLVQGGVLATPSWAANRLGAEQRGQKQKAAKGETKDATRSRLKSLHRKGSAAYSASDYQAAIEAFSSMLALLEQNATERSVTIRGATLFNLGRSYRAAYELDRDERKLRLARDIFKRYLRESDSGYAYSDQPTVQKMLVEVEQELEGLESKRAKKAEAKRKEKAAKEEERRRAEEQKSQALTRKEKEALARKQKIDSEQAAAQRAKQQRVYKTVGWAAMGVGVLGAGLGSWGLVGSKSAQKRFKTAKDPAKRKDIDARGRSMNMVGYAGLSAAVLGLGVGTWMLLRAKKPKTQRSAHIRGFWIGTHSGVDIAF